MQNGILETPFVLDINKKLCLLNDIIIDKTGFSEVLGETIFKQAFNIDKNILQKEIKNKSWFDNQLSGTQVEIFDWDTLKENSTELTSILKDPITNVKFINFLISSDKMYDFKDIAFVLTKTGDLEKPLNVYIDTIIPLMEKKHEISFQIYEIDLILEGTKNPIKYKVYKKFISDINKEVKVGKQDYKILINKGMDFSKKKFIPKQKVDDHYKILGVSESTAICVYAPDDPGVPFVVTPVVYAVDLSASK